MRKVYTTTKYITWHNRRSKKIGKKPKRDKLYIPDRFPYYESSRSEIIRAEPVVAPPNVCLITKTNESLHFFNELRRAKSVSKIGNTCFVQMDLKNIEVFDYSTICVLSAISEELKSKRVILRGNYPENPIVKNQLIESGLLTFMYNDKGEPFKKSEKSDLLFIEKGDKKLTKQDNKRISDIVKQVAKHLTGIEKHVPKLRTILLEICGNSIEWGGTKNRQWLLGVKYDDDNAIFTITDVGKGILSTLNVKFKHKLRDVFTLKTDDEILKGAFVKQYGSNTRKINRNKGLPSIKNGYDTGIIENLKVITNNVILHYDDDINSQVLKDSYFRGTLYRWTVNKKTILKAS